MLFSWSAAGQEEVNPTLETVLQKGHSDYIRAYDLDSERDLAVTGSFDNVLILWQISSGKQIRTFTGHTERIYSVVFSNDHQRVLSCAADHTIREFDLKTGEQLKLLTAPKREVHSARYDQNGRYIYGLTNRDEVWAWDAITGQKLGVFHKSFSAHQERSIFHPTQPWVLSAADYRQSHLIHVELQDTIHTIPFDKPYTHVFSPDGSQFAIGSQKLFAKVFDSETGEELFELKYGDFRCDGCHTKVVYSPNGKQMITTSNKGWLAIWNTRNGALIKAVEDLPERRPHQMLFSPDGDYLLLAFDKEVYIYKSSNGQLIGKLKSDIISYMDFAFSKNGTYFGFPESDGGLAIYRTASLKKERSIRGFQNQPDQSGMNLSYSNWIQQSILNYIQHKRGVKISPDNQFVIMGGIDSSALVINLQTGRVKHRLNGHAKSVIAFDYSQDGQFIATAGGDRQICIWNAKTGELLKRLKGHQETVFDLTFTKDGRQILPGSWDGTIRLWDIEKGTFDYISMEGNSPYRVGFSPDELYFVTGDLDHNFQFWERDAGAPFRTLVGHTAIPADFDFSPDGKEMVTCSWDGHVKEWNVLTGMLVGKMDDHEGKVYAVKYHPTQPIVASGGADGQIILWNTQENKVIKKLKGHATSVTDLDFTSNGKELVSMSVDGIMKVWRWSDKSLQYAYVQLSQNDWLATSPSGHFDGSKNGLKWVNYVRGTEVISVSQVFEKYYTPSLIQQIRSKPDQFNDRSEGFGNALNGVPPASISIYAGGTRSITALPDSVYHLDHANMSLEIEIPAHKDPLSEIRVYNNGKLIASESLEENVVFRGIGARKSNLNVHLAPGKNDISVIVFSENRTESIPTNLIVEFNGEPAKTELFVLTLGVNKYQNPAYNLDYAVNDCKAFQKAIEEGSIDLFTETHIYQLLNDDVNKDEIVRTIDMIRDAVGPEDVFLFYYAGHGVMSQQTESNKEEFYIVTHDVTNLYASPKEISEIAVSARELMQYSMDISAEKQLFILDACYSGGAVQQFAARGNEREKALAQLARSTGTFFITAAQNAEYANEVGKLKHGLFTYALLEILQGTIETAGDEITVNELKTYVEERVPELSETYRGSPQYPTGYSFGRDFPIVIIK